MGADYYETPDQLAADRRDGRPPIGIGDGTVIENAIVDKNCHVGAGAQVIGDPQQVDRIAGEGWEMLDGMLVVAKSAVLRDGWRGMSGCAARVGDSRRRVGNCPPNPIAKWPWWAVPTLRQNRCNRPCVEQVHRRIAACG